MDRTCVDNWNTKIDETWWDDATGPIPFKDIDISNNSRVKGGAYDGEGHLKKLEQSIRSRKEKGDRPLDLPIVIEHNPDKGSAQPFRLLIGHHRIRALIANGYTEFDMVHIHGKVTEDDHLRRRFMVANNDHDRHSKSNSDDDIMDQIGAEFQKLIDDGYSFIEDRQHMRTEIKSVMRKLVGNNKNPKQIRTMVDRWVNLRDQSASASHVTKFKAYGTREAVDTAVKVLNLKGIKRENQRWLNKDTVLHVSNLTQGDAKKYFKTAYGARLDHPNKKIIIAGYFDTATLKSAKHLKEKRDAANEGFRDYREKDRQRYGCSSNYRDVVDEIVYLPQCVDPEDYPENPNKLVFGPW